MAKTGISTACFYPMYPEEAMKIISNVGVSVCEVFFNCFSELEKPILKQLKSIAHDGGVSITSVHPFLSGIEGFLFFSAYDRRAKDGLDIYKRIFEAAAFLGADYFVLHGAPKNGMFLGMEKYAENYLAIAEGAKEFGITLTHENVCRTVTANADFVRDFKKALGDNANFTFDLKQCIRAGQNPFEMIDAMGGCIRNVHINDYDMVKKECRLPFDGNCDIESVINKLCSAGYDGNYIIEVYSDNYSCHEDISVSAQKLADFINSR